MSGFSLLRPLAHRQRERLLAQASTWPIVEARVLSSKVQPLDDLTPPGTAFQTSQVETLYYFTLADAYYGGHLLSHAVSDSEGHRLLLKVPEDTPVQIRYDPTNPDHVVSLAEDNPGFPYPLWSN